MISFNIPLFVEKGNEYINDSLRSKKYSGDGLYTKKCHEWFENRIHSKVLLTTSGSSALDMSAILARIKEGDEVIMPSYTFVSTANAFVLRGAKIVFVDIRPDTMNIDENLIEPAITEKTKAIVVVHYAGVSCEMDKIMEIARNHNLLVIEDAAQGVMSEYNGKALGTIGDFGCYSFHETKNYTMGEGGAIVINDGEEDYENAEIIREKGTNRSQFARGKVNKYVWLDMGSSYLPSDINAAYLYAQLEVADDINNKRLFLWNKYYSLLECVRNAGKIELPVVPEKCKHNGHIFYIKTYDINERTNLKNFLYENGIESVSHYIPLHSSPAGLKFSRFHGEDRYTTKESERILRLPMSYELTEENVVMICEKIKQFYNVW